MGDFREIALQQLKNIRKVHLSEGYMEFGTGFSNPDFAGFTERCDGFGARVINPEDLDMLLRNALKSDKSTIVDVVIGPLVYESLVLSAHRSLSALRSGAFIATVASFMKSTLISRFMAIVRSEMQKLPIDAKKYIYA